MSQDAMKIEKVGTTSLIFVNGIVGDVTKENPAREVTRFYLPSGTFVGEVLITTGSEHISSTVYNFFCKNQMT